MPNDFFGANFAIGNWTDLNFVDNSRLVPASLISVVLNLSWWSNSTGAIIRRLSGKIKIVVKE